MASDTDEDYGYMFQEPEGFYPPEKLGTLESHRMLSGQHLSIKFVGQHPLWGHHLWNAGRTLSHHLEERADELVKNKTVLELGAGGGLPSLVCALKGAAKVVVSDYPDEDLIDNLRYNIEHCNLLPQPSNIVAEGYLWGAPTQDLTKHINSSGFDLLILADLLFNHSEHAKLVKTVQLTLKKSMTSKAYVHFTPYRPWLLEKDLAFFDLAKDAGFTVNKTFEKVMDTVMFEEDPGDELLRRTVYGYELTWQNCDW